MRLKNDEPFELKPVDFVPDKVEKRCEFRSCAHVGRNVFCKTFLKRRRSREHDINLEKADNPVSSSGELGHVYFHVPAGQKDDKQINSKAFERAEIQSQILTSTLQLRIPKRVGSPRMRLSINLVFPTHNAPLNNTGRVP